MKVFKTLNRTLSVLLVAAMVATSTPDVCLTTYAAESEEVTAEDTASEETIEVVDEDDAEPAEDVQDQNDADEELPADDTESNDTQAEDVSDTTNQNADDSNTAGEEDVDTPVEESQPAADAVSEPTVVEDPVDDIIEAQEAVDITITKSGELITTISFGAAKEALEMIEFEESNKTISVDDTAATYFSVVTSAAATVTVSGIDDVDVTESDDYKTHEFSVTFDEATALTITAVAKEANPQEPEESAYEITYTPANNVVYGGDNATSVKESEIEGDNFEFVVTAAAGYEISTVTYKVGEAEAVAATKSESKEDTYLVPKTAITGNVTIAATAVEKAAPEEASYTITYTEAENVVYGADNATSIKLSEIEGDNFEFVVTAAARYEISSVTYKVGDAAAVEATKSESDTYLVPITAITGNVTIIATARSKTIYVNYDYNNSVTYPETSNVPVNADAELQFTAKEGYSIEKVTYQKNNNGREVEAQLKADTTDTYVIPKEVLQSANYIYIKVYAVADTFAVTYSKADNNFLYHSYNDAEATFGQDFIFRVRPIGDYELAVTAKVGAGEEAKTVIVDELGSVDNYYTYRIAAADVTDEIAIDVKAAAKQYTATIDKNDASDIIEKIEYTTKDTTEKTALPEGNTFNVVKNDNIKLYVTLKDAAADTRQEVVVTVDEEEVEAVDGAYTIPNADGDVIVTVTATVIETKDITVTVPDGVTVKYADDAEATDDELKALDVVKEAEGETAAVVGLKGVDVGETYYLFLTAGEGKAVKSVTYGTAVNSELLKAGRAYPITISSETSVAIAVEDSYTVTVNAENASVLYAEEDTTFEKNKFEEITTINTANPIYLHVEEDKNYELTSIYATVTYVKEGAEDVVETNALAVNANGNYEVTPVAKEEYTVKSVTVDVKAERIVHTFTVVSNEAVQILDATGDVIVTATGDAYVVDVPQGDSFDFYVEVADDTYNPNSTKARYATTQEGVDEGNIVDVYTVEGKELFSVPSTDAGNLYIKGYANKIPSYAVSFTSDNADVAKVSVKINDAEAVDVAFTEKAATTAEMKSGSTFAFKPELVENSKYIIKSVTIGNEPLTAGEDGYYVIEGGVVDAYTVDIKTELAAENARIIKLNADEDVAINFTDGTAKTLVAGESYLTETITAIDFTVDLGEYPGFEIDKVTVGEEDLAATDGKYTLPAVDAVGTSQEITITLKAMAAETDKYIKFAESEFDSWLIEVGELPEGITAVEDAEGVYKIAKDTRDAFTFTVFVPYEGQVTGFEGIDANAGIISNVDCKLEGKGIDRVWAYTYSISSSLIADGTLEAPTVIKPIVEDLTYDVTVIEGNFTSVKVNGRGYAGNVFGNTFTFNVGDRVIVEVGADEYLYLVEDGEETLVELDNLNKYAFTVESDMEFAIKTVDPAKYQVNNSYSYLDYVDKNTVDLSITKSVDPSTTLVLAGAEFTDADAKSTITISDDKKVATVTVDEADAGKTLEVVLSYEEYNEETGRKQTVVAGVATVKVAPIVTAVTVQGIKNKATVKANAGSELVYPFTIGTPGAYLDLITVSVTADGKDNASTKVELLDSGVLEIVAPEAPETAKVEIKTNTKEPTTLLTFTVVTSAVAPKVSKVESPLQGYDNLIIKVTADKTFNSAYYNGNLYYALTVTAAEPKANETKPSGVLNNQILYYRAENSTLTTDIKVINNANLKSNTAWKFNVTAELVVVKDDVEPIDGRALDESQVVSVSKLGPKTFSTRNAYYEDKLGVTKKTTSIYQGQEDVLAAVVKFSKNASYITNVTALAYNTDGTVNTDITIAPISDVTGEVYVTVNSNVASGKYNIVLTADAYKDGNGQTMYRSTATLPITVVRSIKSISASVPAQITVTDRKAASITVKPVGYSSESGKNGLEKAKTQKFTYELAFYNENNTALKNAVTIKNNKVTIAKGYKAAVDPQDNMFAIIVKAADYVGNLVEEAYVVEVTNEYLVLSKAYLVDKGTGKPLDTTLTAEEAEDAVLLVLDDENQVVESNELYTVKASNAKAVQVPSSGYGYYDVNFTKAAKNVTFTATTVDGGNKKVVSPKYTINYVPVETIEATWDDSDPQPVLVETAANTYEYKGTYNNIIRFNIATFDAEGNQISSIAEPYNNVKVTAKGGKATLSGNVVSVVPSAEKTTVTIKDASTGKKTLTINLTDKAFVKTAAPSFKADNKIYADYYDSNGDAITQELQLWNAKWTYEQVKIIAPGNDPLVVEGIYNIESTYSSKSKKWGYGYELTLNRPLVAGTYKYTAIYGHTDDDGQFIAETKPATISIKVDKLATFKPVTSYTITPFAGGWVSLTGKPADIDVTFSGLQNANVKGQPNKFRDYFELYGNTLQLKYDLTYDEIKAINKNDLTGYVTYTYGCGNGTVSKTTKITVKLNMNQVKYTATQINVLSLDSTIGSTTILEGKSSKDIGVDAKVYADSEDWTASVSGSYGVNLSAKSPKVGKHTVDLYVVASNSQYCKNDMTTDEIKALGAKVKVTINVKDAATYNQKIKQNKSLQTYDLNHYYYNSYYEYYENTSYGKTVYNDTAKSIQWTLFNNAFINNNKYYRYNPFYVTVQNDSITGAVISGEAPEGVALVYQGGDRWDFVIDKEKVEADKTIKIPVEVTFANGAVKEVIEYTIKTPKKFVTLEDVARDVQWDVEWYVKTYGSVDNDATSAKSEAEWMLHSIYSDVMVASATGKAVKDEAGNDTTEVTLTLKSKVDETLTKDVVVVLGQPSYVQSASRALAIAGEYMETVLNVGEAVAEGKVSLENTDTIYSIRDDIVAFESTTNPSKNPEKIDTSKFLVRVQLVSKTAAEVGQAGSITIKYSIVDRRTLNAGQTVTVTKALKALEAEATE